VTAAKTLEQALEIHVREEIAARERLLALIQRQEDAVLAGASEELARVTREVEGELALQATRARTRQALFNTFARRFAVPVSELSLSSIAERCGAAGERIATLRRELRDATASVARKNRRLNALVSMHRRVLNDLIHTVLGVDAGREQHATGTLVNAEA
jgi:hypothetical protein